jgi:Family of unknown function (DUF6527)
MKKIFSILWDAVRRAVLPWIHRDRIRSVWVEELPESLRHRRLYLLGDLQPWSAAFLCPCGCGEVIQLSLLPNDSPKWYVTFDRDGFPTLVPSVWRRNGCGSHFFLRHGSVVWCRADQVQPTGRRAR